MSTQPTPAISPAQIQTRLRAYIEDATRAIEGVRMPSDARVHYGRKKIKRARAMHRLLREAIGEAAYRREHAALRDVPRPLSQVRDAHVAVETLAGLLKGANGALASRVAPLRRQLRNVRIGPCRFCKKIGAATPAVCASPRTAS